MNWSLLVEPEAEQELLSAAQWYQAQRPGLEERFLRAVEGTIESMRQAPGGYQAIHGKIRQAPIKGFPFVVIYATVKHTVVVLSIFHTSRNPRSKRLRGRH